MKFNWSSRVGRSIVMLCALAVTCLFYLAAFPRTDLTSSLRLTTNWPVKHHHFGEGTHWPGWSGIKHIIAFGDSYTTTSFNHTLAQPSPANPFGNPEYPGVTSSLGPNWIDFLVLNYNRSYIETINLSFGGATLDYFLISPHVHFVKSVKYQIQRWYKPKYSSKDLFPWKSDDTLIAIWCGINDLGNAKRGADAVFELVFAEYAALVDELYQTGARNFLFITVPPFHRAPKITERFPEDADMLEGRIHAWNQNVTSMARTLAAGHPDVEAFVFDTFGIWSRVLDNFNAYPETSEYEALGYCMGCKSDLTFSVLNSNLLLTDLFGQAENMYASSADCEHSLDALFWMDDLHPTFRIHNLTARLISEYLGSVPARIG